MARKTPDQIKAVHEIAAYAQWEYQEAERIIDTLSRGMSYQLIRDAIAAGATFDEDGNIVRMPDGVSWLW